MKRTPDTDPAFDDMIAAAERDGIVTPDESAGLRAAPTVRVPIGAPGERPRLVIVPKSDDERARLGIGPKARQRGRFARVLSAIKRAILPRIGGAG